MHEMSESTTASGNVKHRYVQPHGGQWMVLSPDSERASFRTATRGDAVAKAQRILRNAGGGVVVVRDAEGRTERVIPVTTRRRIAADLRVR